MLDSFLDKLFTPKLFEHEYVLINDVDGKSNSLNAPEETTRDGILSWINAIKSAQLPNWISLPNNAEKVLLTVRGQELLRNLLKMSDDELAYNDTDGEDKSKTSSLFAVPAEMAQRWLNTLPKVSSYTTMLLTLSDFSRFRSSSALKKTLKTHCFVSSSVKLIQDTICSLTFAKTWKICWHAVEVKRNKTIVSVH